MMTTLRLLRVAIPLLGMGLLLIPGNETMLSQSKKGNKNKSEQNAPVKLEPIPQPPRDAKRPELPASTLPLQFIDGERIAFVGNSTAERMNLFGHFETMLHLKFPQKKLRVRNFARPADEVSKRQRSNDYTKIDDPLFTFAPDTIFCFFGGNESYEGAAGLKAFVAEYEKMLDEFASRYPRDLAKSPPRFVLVSPIAFEATGDPFLPSGKSENENLKLYADAVKAVAEKRKLAFVDVFTPTSKTFSASNAKKYTINGLHVNDAGDKFVAEQLHQQLFGNGKVEASLTEYEQLKSAVINKSWYHSQDYRMLNGWYVYGGRRTFDTETFPREYAKIRNMVAVRDQYVWDIAAGKDVADQPDDSKTGELYVPPTRFGNPRQKYSEAEELRYLTPDEFIKSCTVPPGMKIELFADETKFPDLAKPVQINFDNKGRLWVACMPNYPQWKPGDPPANDRLLILEDTDGDGKADKSTVFYDKLHCPTGFEFFNGGVLVMDQPRILWLKDNDGDDKADEVVHLFDGWASDDTHHRGGFEWNHGGRLHLLEGIATSTTLETPWGPHRSQGAGGAYVIDPRSLKIRQFSLPGMYNMWCYVFDEWGQGIVGDGTTANHAWDTPLSGAQFSGRKGLNFVFNQEGMRPALGCEWLVSRNLPKEVQKQFTYACVINMNGLPRFTIADDGAGFAGQRIKQDGKPFDLIRSTDKHFRPGDPQIGPDGALWFCDWANALIGHMQYSQRDPNRDHQRGRVYRLVGIDQPLVKPVTQFGKPVKEILEQFREYEWRARYRARRELHDRPASEVLPVVAEWVKNLPENDPIYDRLLCEALWVQQAHHKIDRNLLAKVLKSKTYQARAAAIRILSDESGYVEQPLDLLIPMVKDEHPRVRTEAVRALSFFQTPEAMAAIVDATKMPMDYWTRYTIEHAIGANEVAWRPDYLAGRIAKGTEAEKMMSSHLASSKQGGAAAPFLKTLLDANETSVETKNKAMTALAGLKGNPSRGREVFVRNCTACHRVGNGEGQDYGPNLEKVATRMVRYKIVESLIDPNAEIDMKYLSTRLELLDGATITGLVVKEDKQKLEIFDGKDKKVVAIADIAERKTLKQSSMPEGQPATMAPVEFLDLVEYLSTLK
ncbi:MAG: HEAT repeat domain-containing protein [Zavarzinella sp.]